MSLFETDIGYSNVVNSQGRRRDEALNNYLYLLQENLRYAFSHIGLANFNDASLAELAEYITKPVYIKVEDELTGRLTEVSVTLDGVSSRVQTIEGDYVTSGQLTQTSEALTTAYETYVGGQLTGYSTIQQTSSAISTAISAIDMSGYATTTALTQTADSLTASISSTNGNVTTLQGTVSGLSTRVSNAEGNISTVSQTADKINWVVSGTNSSTFTLTPRAASLVSESINLDGYVTLTNLADGNTSTYINGGSFSTVAITASTFDLALNNGVASGIITFTDDTNSGYLAASLEMYNFGYGGDDLSGTGVILQTYNQYVLKLASSSSLSVEANGILYMRSYGDVTLRCGSTSALNLNCPNGNLMVYTNNYSGTLVDYIVNYLTANNYI